MKQRSRSLILGPDAPRDDNVPGANGEILLGRFPPLETIQGLAHGVTTRHGPDLTGDPAGENHTRSAALLAAQLGIDLPAWCNQVHGNRVIRATTGGLQGEADALVAGVPGPGVMVRGADCTLVIAAASGPGTSSSIGDTATENGPVVAVGAAHASWRGTVRRVTVRMIQELIAISNLGPERITVAICPSAGPCCYEVGPEVRQEALERLGEDVATCFDRRDGRLFFDLWQANRLQLLEMGIADRRIHLAGYCTICDNDIFPSWRVEGTAAGRLAAIIGGSRDVSGGGSR